ncbi:RluA family pseudouridine synthase [Paenibacillus albiflavus]|uniref:Pseudouridine synthase n=1 Tax=Paenibacillus albiflavus TaxID=2545760 RepID=A0A4R4DZX6_9BACL|nr:RluA family pseudouridine synthase [Paenibacillus albiflavus]
MNNSINPDIHDDMYEEVNEESSQQWIIEESAAGERMDKFLAESLDDVSRTQVQLWIKDGHVKVNGKVVKPNLKLAEGDQVALRIPDPEPTDIRPEAIPIEVVYEDEDVIVVNKQRGLVVHPAVGHHSGTLVNALLYHCKDLSGINGIMRPGIVHRIDKDTSGLIIAAKNDKAHAHLAAQFKDHSITRKYIALVQGNLAHEQGTIDAPIGRDPNDRKLFMVTERNAKHAVTHFSVIERFGDCTLVELKLETGRTHQIRVHMKFIGHALVGDPSYGRTKSVQRITMEGGQALHAAVLGFIHPRTEEYMHFEAPIPEDMDKLLESLRLR